MQRYNTETIKAILEAERISRDPTVKGYKNMDDLFFDLESDTSPPSLRTQST